MIYKININYDPRRKTDNYSASDLTALARDAAFGPIRGELYLDCCRVVLMLLVTGMNAVEVSLVPTEQV